MFFGHVLYTNLERAKDVRIYRQDTLAIKKIEELEEWGNAEYYDICIDVSKVGEDGALRLIEAYINETGVL